MARNAHSRFYPPSTPRSTHATRSPTSRFRRSCTDAWARTRARRFRVGSTACGHWPRPAHQRFRRQPHAANRHHPRLPLAEAYAAARVALFFQPGSLWWHRHVAERHVAKQDEHHRMLAKQDQGCRFFITQSVYDAGSTKSLLSDYALSLRTSGRSPIPVVLTFSPCGSVPFTLEFMKWLGISFPHAWLEKRTPSFGRHAGAASVDLCERVFTDVPGLCSRKAACANRHQRRERLHSKVGDRRVGRAISAIALTSRTVRRCSLPNQALQQTRLAQRNEVRCNDSRTAYRIARSINFVDLHRLERG